MVFPWENSVVLFILTCLAGNVNPLTPNDRYSGRIAPLNNSVAFYIFIQQI
jgi:hypothetical protein